MQHQQQQRILINLDCLIDTRFGTAVRYFGSGIKNLDYNTYYNRDHKRLWDIFGVSRKRWKYCWEKRNKTTLACSKPTNLFFELSQIFSLAAIRGKTSPVHGPLQVFVNTWPYILTGAEKQEIDKSISSYLPVNCECILIRISDRNLTPQVIKESFDSVFLLDLVDWLSQHREALAKCKIPNVTFQYPSWLDDDNDKLRDLIKTDEIDIYTNLQQHIAEFVRLDVVDGQLFTMPLGYRLST